MYLLQYSIDYDSYDSWERDIPQPEYCEGESIVIFGKTKEELIEKIYKDTYTYSDNEVLQNELHYINHKEYKLNEPYLTIHGCWEIKDTIAFKLKDTIEFKEFVKQETKRLQDQEKCDRQRRKIETKEKELAELKRLKEKYENT